MAELSNHAERDAVLPRRPDLPDISGVDFVLVQGGDTLGPWRGSHRQDALAHSPKAQLEGERYTTRTAWNAAAAVEQDQNRSR
jgi:hypothetical protein